MIASNASRGVHTAQNPSHNSYKKIYPHPLTHSNHMSNIETRPWWISSPNQGPKSPGARRIMSSIPSSDDPVQFPATARVGRLDWRQTRFGEAIGVADNRTVPCRWIRVIPSNPEVRPLLRQGLEIQLANIRLRERCGKIPIVSATVIIGGKDTEQLKNLRLFS